MKQFLEWLDCISELELSKIGDSEDPGGPEGPKRSEGPRGSGGSGGPGGPGGPGGSRDLVRLRWIGISNHRRLK